MLESNLVQYLQTKVAKQTTINVRRDDPELVVAKGAALRARILYNNNKNIVIKTVQGKKNKMYSCWIVWVFVTVLCYLYLLFLLYGVFFMLAHNIGIKKGNKDQVVWLIKKNEQIGPGYSVNHILGGVDPITNKPTQYVKIQVCEGTSDIFSENKLLATYDYCNLQAGLFNISITILEDLTFKFVTAAGTDQNGFTVVNLIRDAKYLTEAEIECIINEQSRFERICTEIIKQGQELQASRRAAHNKYNLWDPLVSLIPYWKTNRSNVPETRIISFLQEDTEKILEQCRICYPTISKQLHSHFGKYIRPWQNTQFKNNYDAPKVCGRKSIGKKPYKMAPIHDQDLLLIQEEITFHEKMIHEILSFESQDIITNSIWKDFKEGIIHWNYIRAKCTPTNESMKHLTLYLKNNTLALLDRCYTRSNCLFPSNVIYSTFTPNIPRNVAEAIFNEMKIFYVMCNQISEFDITKVPESQSSSSTTDLTDQRHKWPNFVRELSFRKLNQNLIPLEIVVHQKYNQLLLSAAYEYSNKYFRTNQWVNHEASEHYRDIQDSLISQTQLQETSKWTTVVDSWENLSDIPLFFDLSYPLGHSDSPLSPPFSPLSPSLSLKNDTDAQEDEDIPDLTLNQYDMNAFAQTFTSNNSNSNNTSMYGPPNGPPISPSGFLHATTSPFLVSRSINNNRSPPSPQKIFNNNSTTTTTSSHYQHQNPYQYQSTSGPKLEPSTYPNLPMHYPDLSYNTSPPVSPNNVGLGNFKTEPTGYGLLKISVSPATSPMSTIRNINPPISHPSFSAVQVASPVFQTLSPVLFDRYKLTSPTNYFTNVSPMVSPIGQDHDQRLSAFSDQNVNEMTTSSSSMYHTGSNRRFTFNT